MFGFLFGNEESGGLLRCDNAGHAGMIPARGTTQQDTVAHPVETDLPCECNLLNCHPLGNVQTGLYSSTNGCSGTRSIKTSANQFHGCSNMSTKSVNSEKNAAEISKKYPH